MTRSADAVQSALASLALKDGVMLGGLAEQPRSVALGLAWCAVPPDRTLRETDVNTALKRCLAEEGSFLDVDHVELRRWLVDAGWLARDGFGREYRRVAVGELPAGHAIVASALSAIEPTSWVAKVRAADAQQRAARRQAWEARQAGAAKGPA
jgi:hypothetical protein